VTPIVVVVDTAYDVVVDDDVVELDEVGTAVLVVSAVHPAASTDANAQISRRWFMLVSLVSTEL
jgi:hypothetical protein